MKIKVIIFKIYRIINSIYDNYNINFDGNLFCFFFNLKAKLRNKKVIFKTNKIKSSYIAKSKKYKRLFKAKKQNLISYSNGIESRALSLAKDYMLDKIEFLENDVIVDCGANIGDLEIFFKERGHNINYIGIEPSPSEFSCLKENLILKKSKCFNFALFDKNGSVKFYISSEFGDSSIFNPINYTQEIIVQSKRFDSLNKELKIAKIKLLKLEAEGAEPEILLGFGNYLQNVEYISADLGFERGLKQESTLPRVSNFLIGEGFEMIALNYPRLTALFKNKKKK